MEQNELLVQMEMIPAEAITDETELVEIMDSNVLARVNSLIPGIVQTGNAVNNVSQAFQTADLYRVIIPSGAKLANSKAMEGAMRGFYHGTNGIKGNANLVAAGVQQGAVIANSAAAVMSVASMIVGQYYMTQINSLLGKISDGISQISDFQNNEYRSRVFSLVAHVKKIADFQTEILENDELRLSKISQLDNLEEECTKLLGQANLMLAEIAKKTGLNYKEYENVLGSAHNWFMYQKSLLDILHKISDLRYTLHLGAVSREQCTALLPIYTKQIADTQECLTAWHRETGKRLNIDIDQARRRRGGLDRFVHRVPGLFNDDFNFCSIETKTAKMITAQTSGYENSHYIDTTELYNKDVQLILRDGRIYYLPEKM